MCSNQTWYKSQFNDAHRLNWEFQAKQQSGVSEFNTAGKAWTDETVPHKRRSQGLRHFLMDFGEVGWCWGDSCLTRVIGLGEVLDPVMIETEEEIILSLGRVATENSFGENNLGSRHWFTTTSPKASQRGLSSATNFLSRPSFVTLAKILIPALYLLYV